MSLEDLEVPEGKNMLKQTKIEQQYPPPNNAYVQWKSSPEPNLEQFVQ